MNEVRMESFYRKYGPIWKEFETGELIGQGSFGNVWELLSNGKPTGQVLKEVLVPPESSGGLIEARLQGLDEKGALLYYEGMKERALEEVLMMRHLFAYDEFVKFHDYQACQVNKKRDTKDFGWMLFIRMEKLTPFKKKLVAEGITVDELYKLGVDMCNALMILKQEGIIHRDIKPENIFYDEKSKRYKLGDFGISYYRDRETEVKGRPGTLTYMSPEVYKGKCFSYEDDMYAVGMLLYKLLNDNRIPFLERYPVPYLPNERNRAMNKRFQGEKIPPASIYAYSEINTHPSLIVENGEMEKAYELEKIARRAIDAKPDNRFMAVEDMYFAIKESMTS